MKIVFIGDSITKGVDLWREMILRGFTENHAQYYADSIHLNVAGHNYVTQLAARPKHAGVFLP